MGEQNGVAAVHGRKISVKSLRTQGVRETQSWLGHGVDHASPAGLDRELSGSWGLR